MFCGNCTMQCLHKRRKYQLSNTYRCTVLLCTDYGNNDLERFLEIIRKLIVEDKDYETISMFIFLHNTSLKPPTAGLALLPGAELIIRC